jgi:predicted transposase YdaD
MSPKTGRAEGREEGRAEGHEKGQRALLRKQLALKFGELTTEQEARVEAAQPEELERYAERLLTAGGIDAVLGGEPGEEG